MNIEYLKDLYERAKLLQLRQVDVEIADEIKLKTAEALKLLFPSELLLPGEISRLKFTPKRNMSFNSGVSYDFSGFRTSKSHLMSTLSAKIDLLEYQLKQTAVKAEKEPDSLEVKVLKIEVQNLGNKNAKFAALVDQCMKESDELSSKLKQANAELKETSFDVARLARERDRAGKINWGKTWTMVVVAFGIGAGTIAVKVDYDKRKLQDTVDEQKATIDSLRKIVSGKHSVSIVQKGK